METFQQRVIWVDFFFGDLWKRLFFETNAVGCWPCDIWRYLARVARQCINRSPGSWWPLKRMAPCLDAQVVSNKRRRTRMWIPRIPRIFSEFPRRTLRCLMFRHFLKGKVFEFWGDTPISRNALIKHILQSAAWYSWLFSKDCVWHVKFFVIVPRLSLIEYPWLTHNSYIIHKHGQLNAHRAILFLIVERYSRENDSSNKFNWGSFASIFVLKLLLYFQGFESSNICTSTQGSSGSWN